MAIELVKLSHFYLTIGILIQFTRLKRDVPPLRITWDGVVFESILVVVNNHGDLYVGK